MNWTNQIKINFWYIVKTSWSWTWKFFGALQTLVFLCDFDKILPNDINFWHRIMMSISVFCLCYIGSFLYNCVYIVNNNRVTVIKAGNGHNVYVEYGNLFAENDECKNIVVTANRCFDTLVDNDLISENTIHGMAVKKICEDGYSAEKLNEELQKDLLHNKKIKPIKSLSEKQKRKGNLKQYPVGTIAEFKKSKEDKSTYFFVGMSSFNHLLHPETTDAEYLVTIQSLIEYCSQRSQRFPVYVPIIGTYGRNNKKSERELLECMISVFRLNRHIIDTDIHIVVYQEYRNSVSIYDL